MNLQLSRRPLCLLLSVFLLSFFICSLFFSKHKLLIAGAVILLCLILKVIVRKKDKYALLCIILLPIAFSLVFSYFSFDLSCRERAYSVSGRQRQATAVVIEKVGDYGYLVNYTAYLKYSDNDTANMKVRLVTHFASDYKTGDLLNITNAKITPSFTRLSLEDGYDLSKGVLCEVSCDVENQVELEKHDISLFPYTQSAALRAKLSIILARYLDGDSLALSKALIYGDKSSLSGDIKNAFSALGISHALAISGLHLGIIMGFLSAILEKLRLSKAARSIVILAAGLLYAFIAGLSPSVCRAYLMYSIYILAEFSRRRRDPPTTLITAVSLICLVSPNSVFDIGLHLSFFSTLGILTMATRVTRKIKKTVRFRFVNYVLSVCAVTVFANLFILPYSIYCFGYISLISPVSNLLFLPLITLMVYLAPCIIIFSFAPFIASAVAKAVETVSTIILFLCRESYSLAQVFLLSFENGFARFAGIFALTLIILCLLFLKRKHLCLIPFGLYLISVMCAYVACFALSYNNLFIVHITNGRSDALSFVYENRATLIENSYSDYSFLSGAIDCTQNDGVTKVNRVVITHFHENTPSTLNEILSSYPNIEILVVFSNDSDTAYSIQSSAEAHGVDICFCSYEETLELDYCTLTVNAAYGHSSHPEISIYFKSKNITLSYLAIENKTQAQINLAPVHGVKYEKYAEIKKTVVYKEKLT